MQSPPPVRGWVARLFPSGGEDEREQRLAVLLEAEFAGSGPLMSAQFRSRVQVRCTGHVFPHWTRDPSPLFLMHT